MRHPVIASLGALAVLIGGGGAGAYAAWGREHGVTASRAATDRACEAAYVTPAIAPPHTTIPSLDLREVAKLDQPTAMVFHPSGVALIGERAGEVVVMHDGTVDPTPVIDLSDDTEEEGDGGLLSLAYSPDGTWLYVYRADSALDDVVTAYPSPGGVPEQDGEVTILTVDHPFSEMHHGGGFAFGPDGDLYIGTGDGGGLGDPSGRAQSLDTLLGKVLRIKPTPAAAHPYEVPADNPFVHHEGAKPEIFSYGLRNPFRLSFDPDTGDLWIGDVGQSCWEEIDYRQAGEQGGENFGWDRREGSHPFEGERTSASHVLPLHDYSHENGWCVVIAGFVYHGSSVPAMDGAFLFTDYCKGEVVALRHDGDVRTSLELTSLDPERPVALVAGPDGEPWVLSLDGGVYQVVP